MEDLKSKYADLHVSIKEYCDKKDLEFEMPEEVLNKLINSIKKLHYLFLQVYFETKEGGLHELGKGSY